jgi:3-phosphoshikimate 1-carboxyvinyltransferase
MLPVVGALGVNTTFQMEGRLPYRPLSPLWEEMERMGCSLTRPTETTLQCTGKLQPGAYTIDGSVSSQFITGLLFALSLLDNKSTVTITGKIESKPYIELTKNALRMFSVDADDLGKQKFISPGDITVEGDWSNGAFFLVANYMGCHVNVRGLSHSSRQGDRAVVNILESMRCEAPTIDAADIPDLVPVLSVAAAYSNGAVCTNIARLRLKESDRVNSVCNMLHQLGCHAEADENTLKVYPGKFSGGIVDTCKDHRIAMSAAIAASVASGKVSILGAECAAKSYPKFWEIYAQLGGYYEQHLR